MRIDFSSLKLQTYGFSKRPMSFLDVIPGSCLARIFEIIAIETGSRAARAQWQKAQLQNLLTHAAERSPFWRTRIGTAKIADLALAHLPIQTRGDVKQQVKTEGSLLKPNDGLAAQRHLTSGSSGTPVQFYISSMNGEFNTIRSLAQFLLEGNDLSLNLVRFGLTPVSNKEGLKVVTEKSWLGPLDAFIESGSYRIIHYFHPDMQAFRRELERLPIGYLVAAHWGVETLLQYIKPAVFKDCGLKMWIPIGSPVSPEVRKSFTDLDIPVRANYSAEEVGLIASECQDIPGNYHVATSNVIVEVDTDDPFQIENHRLGKVLVTHLHSYATPFVRYDLGDIAHYSERCECGHDGPVLSRILGRNKNLLKLANGKVSPFYMSGETLHKITTFDEFRIRQTGINTIVLEIGGREHLSPDITEAFHDLIKSHAGAEFNVEVRPVIKIDWGVRQKRLGFYNEIL